MKLLALSHLLLSGERSVGEFAHLLGISNTYASQVSDSLAADGFVLKERRGKRVLIRANMESPFVQSFSRLAVIVGGYPPYTPVDFLEPQSRRKVLWQLNNGEKSISEVSKATGYSRPVIYDSLKPLLETGVLSIGEGKIKIYRVNDASPLVKPLFEVLDFFESDIDLRPLLERISSDARVVAMCVFGSQVAGKRDKLSDVDALVVVGSPRDKDIVRDFEHANLQLNVYSRRGIIQLARSEPWFLGLTLEGRILKGKDFLEGLVGIPADPDFDGMTSEVREMLDSLGQLPKKEKARIMMYCIRTGVSMRLFLEGKLSQKRFVDEVAERYPEFNAYRSNKKMDKQTLASSRKKISEDIEYVEERKEEER